MKNETPTPTLRFCNSGQVEPGDVVVDRSGNEMVVIEVVNRTTGECYALFNGEIKLINASRAARIISEKEDIDGASR
jgi:hypothetical protein